MMKNLYSIVSNDSYVMLIFLAKNSICYTLFDLSRLLILAIHKISHIFCVCLHWNCPNYLILTISNLRLTFERFCGYPFRRPPLYVIKLPSFAAVWVGQKQKPFPLLLPDSCKLGYFYSIQRESSNPIIPQLYMLYRQTR